MLPTRSLFCVALTLMSIAGSARASAQTSDAQSEPAQMDLFDVWRRIRHTPAPAAAESSDGTERMIVVTPVIGSNPSAGFTFGVAGQLAVVRGDPRTTRISAGIASLTFSTKKQAMLNMRFALFTNGIAGSSKATTASTVRLRTFTVSERRRRRRAPSARTMASSGSTKRCTAA